MVFLLQFLYEFLFRLGFRGQAEPGKQIGAAAHRAQDRLLAPPAGYLLVVAGAEDLRHGAAVPDRGAAVLGIFQKAVPVALLRKAFRIGQDPGQEPAHRVAHCHGSDLAAGEHEVAQGELFVHALVDKALVDALVVAADQDEVLIVGGQAAGLGLVAPSYGLRKMP